MEQDMIESRIMIAIKTIFIHFDMDLFIHKKDEGKTEDFIHQKCNLDFVRKKTEMNSSGWFYETCMSTSWYLKYPNIHPK